MQTKLAESKQVQCIVHSVTYVLNLHNQALALIGLYMPFYHGSKEDFADLYQSINSYYVYSKIWFPYSMEYNI